MHEKGVVDRLEADLAVVLVGSDERPVTVKRDLLPKGVKEGDWLSLETDGVRVLTASIDEGATAAARARVAEKLERLRRRGNS